MPCCQIFKDAIILERNKQIVYIPNIYNKNSNQMLTSNINSIFFELP